MPQFRAKILKPIQDKVPGLGIKEGKININGISIDELSGSEVIKLGLKLMSLDSKASLLLINEAEALDIDSIREIEWDKFNAIIARVSDTPVNKEWNSIEMKV